MASCFLISEHLCLIFAFVSFHTANGIFNWTFISPALRYEDIELKFGVTDHFNRSSHLVSVTILYCGCEKNSQCNYGDVAISGGRYIICLSSRPFLSSSHYCMWKESIRCTSSQRVSTNIPIWRGVNRLDTFLVFFIKPVSQFIILGVPGLFLYFLQMLWQISFSWKQCGLFSDVALCGVWSGSALLVCLFIARSVLMCLRILHLWRDVCWGIKEKKNNTRIKHIDSRISNYLNFGPFQGCQM